MAFMGPVAGAVVGNEVKSEALVVASSPGVTNTAAKTIGRGAYEKLGVAEDATQREITVSYRKSALELHPDKNPPDRRAEFEKKFQELNDAYNLINTPEKRAEHDKKLNQPAATTNAAQITDKPLAIQDAPAPTQSITPKPQPQMVQKQPEQAKTEGKKPEEDGPGQAKSGSREDQIDFFWKLLGDQLAKLKDHLHAQRTLKAAEQHKEDLFTLSQHHGVEKVAGAINDATKGGIKADDYKKMGSFIKDKLLDADTKAKIGAQHSEATASFKQGHGLSDKQADAAARFSLSSANHDEAKNAPKHDPKDIAAVFKSAGDGKMPNHTEATKKLAEYGQHKETFSKMLEAKPTPNGAAAQSMSKEKQAEMAAQFSISKQGQKSDGKAKYTAEEVINGISTFAYHGSTKDPSNKDIEGAIKSVKQAEVKAKMEKGSEEAKELGVKALKMRMGKG